MEGEDFDHFVMELKAMANSCNFGDQEESLIRDRIIIGIRDKTLMERLLRVPELTLAKAETQCRAAEASKLLSKEIRESPSVDSIPSVDNNCSDSDNSDNTVLDEIILSSIDRITINNNEKTWYQTIKVGHLNVKFKLDTGAQCNVLPPKIFQKLYSLSSLTNCEKHILTYGNNKIEIKGSIIIELDVESLPILGLNTCVGLGLIKRLDEMNVSTKEKSKFINLNKDVFEGVGKVPFQYKIILSNNAIPVSCCNRRVPETIKTRLKTELDRLSKKEIIEKVEEPTEWVNNIVIIEKNNKSLRLCLDPCHLNKFVCMEQYPIPTFEEIALKLKDKKIFTVLDMKEGFFHIQLDNESSKLCTFITPFGKYKYKRLPFGLKTSPEVFQKLNEKMFGDLDVEIYFDDCIITGKDEIEHDMLMKKFLERARKYNVKFNADKVQYKISHVKYLGQIISGDGTKADPDQIRSILELQEPKNKKELLRVLGMFNYLIKYIPNLAEHATPLRNLIKSKSDYVWTVDHSDTFNNLKKIITQLPTLSIFDPEKPIVIQTDASQSGLGGCLLQDNKPICYCSRALTECEIPLKYRQEVLKKLHKAHFGITKTKLRARQIVYWPGMSQEIEDYIKKCKVCEKFASKNVKEPLIPHKIPDLPFQNVASDLLFYAQKDYLVVVDYYSRWIELQQIPDKTANTVIKILKKIFARFGIPETFMSDNMPFQRFEFKSFAKKWNIRQVTSSPRYPKYNGLAEKAVGICKKMLKKCQESNDDIEEYLLEHRVTPKPGLNLTPSQLLFSRILRTTIPTDRRILKPKLNKDIDKIMENRQNKVKDLYDRGAKEGLTLSKEKT
nr:uncharacterized protein K02A2.6-like [Onthophagus taurus]